jgi:LacI family transcriptional regulator
MSAVGRNESSRSATSSRHHATIRDIAQAAGVSETTVSLAFRPNSRISQRTRQRVLAIGDQLRYLPNLSARNLRLGGWNAIGFLVNDIANPFYAAMVQTAELIAQKRGYQVIFSNGHWNAAREVHALESMIRARVLGALVCPCERTHESLDLLTRHSVPCVVVDTAPEEYRGALVGNNLVAAGDLAAKHLMDVQCRKVALLTADRQMSSFSAFQKIQKGFLETLEQYGISAKEVPVAHAGLTIDQGRYGFEWLAKRAGRLDGILCVNDLSAIGVIEAADARGVRIGQDLAVVGIDDLEISRTPRISLTSIRQPNRRVVELAVNALIDSIESRDPPEIRLLLDPELVVRNSTRRRS